VNNKTPFKPLSLDSGFLLSFATGFQSRVVRACPDRLKDDSLQEYSLYLNERI